MRETSAPSSRSVIAVCLFLCLSLASCAGAPDLQRWRETQSAPRDLAQRGELGVETARVQELRKSQDLQSSRDLALKLAAENPEEPTVLYLASRAESDAVFLFAAEEKEKRNLAALSALDYSRHARAAGANSADALAQHAWAMGTTTHLQPMFSRAEHARQTLEAVDIALEKDPQNTVALATKSILRLRLATLPWIAKVMASGAPEGSIEEATELAHSCVDREASVENRLLLAKALIADDQKDQAVEILRTAMRSADRYPRDHALRPTARDLLNTIR